VLEALAEWERSRDVEPMSDATHQLQSAAQEMAVATRLAMLAGCLHENEDAATPIGPMLTIVERTRSVVKLCQHLQGES
jgi:hypothetical protein